MYVHKMAASLVIIVMLTYKHTYVNMMTWDMQRGCDYRFSWIFIFLFIFQTPLLMQSRAMMMIYKTDSCT